MGSVRFTGLSTTQCNLLTEHYARFVPRGGSSHRDCIECRAFRLPSPLQIDPTELTVEGLYTPLRIRNQEGIELTGVNFKAQIPAIYPGGQASLGVAQEQEIAQANVVENFLRVLTAHRSLALGGLLLHSAGLVFDERAYLFVGRSGAGKTTLTRKAYRHGAIVLSDDINLVLPVASGYRAYAVPFTGEFGRTLDHREVNASYPVAGIILLEQAGRLAARPLGAAAAVARLMVGCPFVNSDEHETSSLLDNLAQLAAQIPVLELLSRREDTIGQIMATVRSTLPHDQAADG